MYTCADVKMFTLRPVHTQTKKKMLLLQPITVNTTLFIVKIIIVGRPWLRGREVHPHYPWSTCRRVLRQDTEPQVYPGGQALISV